ncbi:MAG: TIGR04086 family membrane protein [Defluviitaleaceae bacterium]|nr:TIGR04086 family membrane protein [Defluviitaleaceae bacterium]
MEQKKFNVSKEQVLGVVLGVIIAYAITAIGFIATAIAITYTNLSEGALPAIVMVTCVVSVMFAGFDASKKAHKNGWAWGMVAGLVYAIVFITIIIITSDGFNFDSRKLLLLALSLVGGGIGGAIGINFRKR